MSLADVRWIANKHAEDDRGALSVVEESALPFHIKRMFYIYQVPKGLERGCHAQLDTKEYLIGMAGRCVIDVSDGEATETYVLDDPNRGLYLPEMTWVRLYDFEPNTVVVVLCDTAYDHSRVVRTWDHYCRLQREAALTNDPR